MPDIGPFELVLILAVVVIVFGVGRLPEVGGAIGKSIREFRKASREPEEHRQLGEPDAQSNVSPPATEPAAAAEALVKCPQCGSSSAAGAKFCGECGTSLRAHVS
jgi:sec-independent protein translocase protein TatA